MIVSTKITFNFKLLIIVRKFKSLVYVQKMMSYKSLTIRTMSIYN